MTKISRRPTRIDLDWEPGIGDQMYRVVITNQDTGVKRTVYEGRHPAFRLPPEMRLTGDQLAYRVDSRPLDDPSGEYRRLQTLTGIPRLGDDFDSPAEDLLLGEVVEGANAYRLEIHNADTKALLVAYGRHDRPAFLLPAGQLRSQPSVWAIRHRTKEQWLGGEFQPVTEAMIAAAEARARKLYDVVEAAPPPFINDAPRPPGRIAAPGEAAAPFGTRVLLAVDVTADVQIASSPAPAVVAAEQWIDGKGGGAAARMAALLEASGRRGVFFLDALAAEVLGKTGRTAMAALSERLLRAGHAVELLATAGPWAGALGLEGPPEGDPGALVRRAADQFEAVTGKRPAAARVTQEMASMSALEALAGAGVRAVVVDGAARSGLPMWMRGRQSPFAVFDDLAMLPVGTAVSTPAHPRDRVVRHPVVGGDATIAATLGELARTLRGAGGDRLLTVRLDPLSLLARSRVRSAREAQAWNDDLARGYPKLQVDDWRRDRDVFERADGDNEIALDTLGSVLRSLADGGFDDVGSEAFTLAALARWTAGGGRFETIIEQRRGAQLMRRTAVRRYDEAYRQALLVEVP